MPVEQTTGNNNTNQGNGINSGGLIVAPQPNNGTTQQQSRSAVENLHQPRTSSEDLELSTVGKALTQAQDLGSEALDATGTIFKAGLSGAKHMADQGGKSKNLSDLLKIIVGGGFGLGAIKSLLGAPQYISNREVREKTSPLIITAGKFLTGGTLAFGLIRGVLGGAGLSMSGIGFGLLGFIALSVLSKSYENPQSAAGKALGAVGLRDKIVDALDFLKIEKIFQ